MFSLGGETVYFVNCKRVPQQARNRFVAESATFVVSFDFFDRFQFDEHIARTLYFLQRLQQQPI